MKMRRANILGIYVRQPRQAHPSTKTECPSLLRKVVVVLVRTTLHKHITFSNPVVDHWIGKPLVAAYAMSRIESTYSIPGPIVTSYDMPGIESTYSLPEPIVTSYAMPGIEWTYSIPGP